MKAPTSSASSRPSYELDRASLAAVLRGLFTADGTVVDSGEKSQYVGLDSTSLELLVQVQRMLLGFGIKARIYENRRGGQLTSILPDGKGGSKAYPVREMHSLRITRSSRRAFEREIGFVPGEPEGRGARRPERQCRDLQRRAGRRVRFGHGNG